MSTNTGAIHSVRTAAQIESPGAHTCEVRSATLFGGLPVRVLEVIQSAMRSFTYPAGAFLFFENDLNHGVYVLCSGQVKLSVSSRSGRRLTLHIAQPGEALGLLSAMADRPEEATAEVLRATTTSFLRREDLLRLAAIYPELNAALIRQLTGHFHAICEQLRTIGLSATAQQKLARLLLSWSRSGRETEEGVKTNVPLTHEQIAELLGSSRETVTRTLAEFKNRRLIILRGATMLIPNLAALQALGDA